MFVLLKLISFIHKISFQKTDFGVEKVYRFCNLCNKIFVNDYYQFIVHV